jgi:hypothetical protein
MATIRTKTTELSVAFGLLGREPSSVRPDEIEFLFDETLDARTFEQVKREYYSKSKQRDLYSTLFELGLRARQKYEPFRNVRQVQWTGPSQQSQIVSSSKDLVALGIPISIKTDSDVVYNLSPANLFEAIPQGGLLGSGSENWFLKHAEEELNEAYMIASRGLPDFPDNVLDFERKATRSDRSAIQEAIKQLSKDDSKKFLRAYISMCHHVSEISAEMFNKAFGASISSRSRTAFEDSIVGRFFRIDSTPYILMGTDGPEPMVQLVPDITKWRSETGFVNLEAFPALDRKQCVVEFSFECRDLDSGKIEQYPFHAEIRWSHGRFCGNPEAKLYKDFRWQEVSFFDDLMD